MGLRTIGLCAVLASAGCSRAVLGGPEADDDTGGPDAAPELDPADARPVDAALPPDATPCVDGDAQGSLGGRCYMRYSATTATWQGAADICALIDAHLVTIGAADEDALVIALAPAADIWIGASDTAVEGTFAWITGEPLGFTHWGMGEPNDAGTSGEDCAIMRKVGTAENPLFNLDTWDDRPCDRLYGFICERD